MIGILEDPVSHTWWMGILEIAIPSAVIITLFFLARHFERRADTKKLLRECYSEWYQAMTEALAAVMREETLLEVSRTPKSTVPASDLLNAHNDTNVMLMKCQSQKVKISLVDPNQNRNAMVGDALVALGEFRGQDQHESGEDWKGLSKTFKRPIDDLIESGDAR